MKIERKTGETKIALDLDINGSGEYKIETEDPFLTHMCETLAKYSRFNLAIKAEGEGHHLIEDVGICTGRVVRESIEDKPIRRLGSAIVPMDDALVLVSLDLIDRPYAEIKLPDPMYMHYLRSFALEAKLTLHVKVLRGEDQHHQIEACFKALGLSLREAAQEAPEFQSTKGEVQWSI